MDQKYLWIEALKFNDRGLIPAIAIESDYNDNHYRSQD